MGTADMAAKHSGFGTPLQIAVLDCRGERGRESRGVGATLLLIAFSVGANASALAAQPLFASDDALEIVVDAPWRRLRRQGGEHQGIMSLGSGEARLKLDVAVAPRGHSRLEYCRFPPIKVGFAREQVKSTVFAGQDELKLVTKCGRGPRYADNVLLELWIYRALNLLTPRSFRTRFAHVRYRDSEGKDRDRTEPAFFIEDDERMAARLGLQRIDIARLDPKLMDQLHLALITMFQLMIGNTDWSVIRGAGDDECCHNGEALMESHGTRARYYVVPYDFDQAGLIDARYARPYEGLGIRSVRQRIYRGFCSTNTHLDEIVERFDARRDAMLSLLATAALTDASRRRASRYLDGFFDIMSDPSKLTRQIESQCRG